MSDSEEITDYSTDEDAEEQEQKALEEQAIRFEALKKKMILQKLEASRVQTLVKPTPQVAEKIKTPPGTYIDNAVNRRKERVGHPTGHVSSGRYGTGANIHTQHEKNVAVGGFDKWLEKLQGGFNPNIIVDETPSWFATTEEKSRGGGMFEWDKPQPYIKPTRSIEAPTYGTSEYTIHSPTMSETSEYADRDGLEYERSYSPINYSTTTPYISNDDFMEDLERKEIAIAHRYPKSPTYDYDSNLFEDSLPPVNSVKEVYNIIQKETEVKPLPEERPTYDYKRERTAVGRREMFPKYNKGEMTFDIDNYKGEGKSFLEKQIAVLQKQGLGKNEEGEWYSTFPLNKRGKPLITGGTQGYKEWHKFLAPDEDIEARELKAQQRKELEGGEKDEFYKQNRELYATDRRGYNQKFTEELAVFKGWDEPEDFEGGYVSDDDSDSDSDFDDISDPKLKAILAKQQGVKSTAKGIKLDKDKAENERRRVLKLKQDAEIQFKADERVRILKEKEEDKKNRKVAERVALKAELRNRRDALLKLAEKKEEVPKEVRDPSPTPPPTPKARKAPPPKPQKAPDLSKRPAPPSRPAPNKEELVARDKITSLTTRKRAVRSDKGKKHKWGDGRETTEKYKDNEGTDWSKLRGKANKRKCAETGKWVSC